MEELLKKLLENEVLTPETRKDLESAFKQKIDSETKKAREEATASVTAELNEKWIIERDTLIEALDAKVSEVLKEELAELKEDIERFRDLEAEYAEKLVEAKGEMAKDLKKDVDTLIEKLDAFLEIRLAKELTELREDIASEKKKQFGKKVFEAFVEEFKKHYAADDSVEGKLNETEQRLDDALKALEDAEKKIAKMERGKKLDEVLKPLSGRSKEVMEAILKNVDTPLLEDAYKTYIGRVLKETVVEEPKKDEKAGDKKTSEKETKVLAEGKKEEKKLNGKVVSGDDKEKITEGEKLEQQPGKISEEKKQQLRRLAGIPS